MTKLEELVAEKAARVKIGVPPETGAVAVVPPTETLPADLKRADSVTIFEDLTAKAEKLKAAAETLTVTSASQVLEMKLARTTRLAIRELRIAVEHKRVELGEFHLKAKQTVDRQAKALREYLEPLESRLLDQEQFVERETARVEAANRDARTVELTPFLDGAPVAIDLGKLSQDDYSKLLAATRDAQAARLARETAEREAAARKAAEEAAEKERMKAEVARLQAESIERERVAREERERLQAEMAAAAEVARKEKEAATAAAEAERQRIMAAQRAAAEAARKEREALEAKAAAERKAAADALKAEQERARKAQEAADAKAKTAADAAEAKARKEREELEAQRKAAADAHAKAMAAIAEQHRKEEAAKAAEIKATQARAAAPDRDKLVAYAASIRSVPVPSMSTPLFRAAMISLRAKVVAMADIIETKAGELAGTTEGKLL